MEQLPLELIEKILMYGDITIKDVANLSETCKHLHNTILNSTLIWKKKFHSKWPKLMPGQTPSYYEECKYLYDVERRMMSLLETMPSRFNKKYMLSDVDLEEWIQIVSEKPHTYHFLISILMEILCTDGNIEGLDVVPLSTPGNKTLKYYATTVLRFLKQRHLSEVWSEFIQLPWKYQILEKGALFVAQWCQPEKDLTDETIQEKFSYITSLAKLRLFDTNPEHPLFKTSVDELERWKVENIEKSQWNVAECWQVIGALQDVMFNGLRFSGNVEDYYHMDNSLINMVLDNREGLPITLCIIYESVGRRLGVLFEPMNFPAHFLLRFNEGVSPNSTSHYIDVFNCRDMSRRCPYSANQRRNSEAPVASAVEVVQRIVNNLSASLRECIDPNGGVTLHRSILELMVLVSPHQFSGVRCLAELYAQYRVISNSFEEFLQTQTCCPYEGIAGILQMFQVVRKQHLNVRPAQIAQRNPELKYAVGMVMALTEDRLFKKCVIYDWDTTSRSPRRPSSAPHYNVLMEDGAHRYVPQCKLVPSPDVGHLLATKDWGRYFSHFFENHFVPNIEKEKEYPYDTEVRHHFYHEFRLHSDPN